LLVRRSVTDDPEATLDKPESIVIVELAIEIEPGVTVMVGFGVEVMGEPLRLALIVVAEPDKTPVKEAV
jgi:hypothetical protein